MKRSLFRKDPTALEIAVKELEDAKREKLRASREREYYCAIEDVLTHRIERLRNTIMEMADEGENPCST